MAKDRSSLGFRKGRIGAFLALLAALVAIGVAVVPGALAADESDGKSKDWRLGYATEFDFNGNVFAAFNAGPYFVFSASTTCS